MGLNGLLVWPAGWDGDVRPATATSQHAMPGPLTSSMRRSSTTSSMHARPVSAGHPRGSTANTTQKDVPCYGMSVIMDVDLMTGQPASAHICSTQPWRVARVKSCAVQHSSYGHSEGGKRAQHQTYHFYKYNGKAAIMDGVDLCVCRPVTMCVCVCVCSLLFCACRLCGPGRQDTLGQSSCQAAATSCPGYAQLSTGDASGEGGDTTRESTVLPDLSKLVTSCGR